MKKYILLILAFLALGSCESDEEEITLQYEFKTICTPVEGGTIEPLSGMFNEGSEIEVTAVPAENYVFKYWGGCVSGSENPTKVFMTQNRMITAVFEKMTYELTIDVQGKGYVRQTAVVNKSTTDYPVGFNVELTAVPDVDWKFDRWEGDYVGTDNPIVLTMNEPKSVTVFFKDVELEKTFVPDDNFEQALIDLGLDDILDDYVRTRNIADVEQLDISDRNISDLTGLEDFESLISLDAANNNLVSIPQSFGGSLPLPNGRLDLRNNNLNSLDISNLMFVGVVYVENNPLTCIQLSESQYGLYLWGMLFIFADEGLEVSEDCD